MELAGKWVGALLGGVAKVIVALRTAPSIEATHVPEKPQVLCSGCDRTLEKGHPELIRITIHVLNADLDMRVHAVGVCPSARIWRKHKIEAEPTGRPFLPSTVTRGAPLSLDLLVSQVLSSGIERGRRLRGWAGGSTLWAAPFSSPIVLPKLSAPEPALPALCPTCQSDPGRGRRDVRAAAAGRAAVLPERHDGTSGQRGRRAAPVRRPGTRSTVSRG